MKSTVIVSLLLIALIPSALAKSEAAEALVKELKIQTYTASREDDDIYELLEGFVVRTKYCYTYAYSETVVVTDDKIIFIGSDDVCDIADIYKK